MYQILYLPIDARLQDEYRLHEDEFASVNDAIKTAIEDLENIKSFHIIKIIDWEAQPTN